MTTCIERSTTSTAPTAPVRTGPSSESTSTVQPTTAKVRPLVFVNRSSKASTPHAARPATRTADTIEAGPTAQAVGPASIVFAVLVAGLAAWGVLALLERFTKTSDRTFAVVGWTVLVLSLLGPVLTGAVGVVLVVLLAMHLVTGATLVIGLPLAGRRRRRVRGGGE